MATNVTATTYIKNVGKSFGYALGDVFSQYNPIITNVAKETKETTTDLYEKIKDFSFNKSSIDEKSLKGTIKSSIDDAWNNLKDDLKTGNFYNKNRQEALENDLARAMGFDINFDDMDFNFDEDWGDDSEESSTSKAIDSSNEKSTGQIISAMDQVGYGIANTVSQTTMESASYIAKSAKESSRALYSLHQKGYSQVTSALLSINNSIGGFAEIGKPLTAHMNNSSIFYTRTTDTLNKMYQTLEDIKKNTTPAKLATQGKITTLNHTFSDIFSEDEGINISAFKDMITSNFKDSKEMLQMGLDAIKDFKSENGSMGKNISIAQMATVFMTKMLIPKVFKDSMKNLNETLKYAGVGALEKIKHNPKGGFLSLISDLILPRDGYRSKYNSAKFERGAVAWDGIARHALVKVIPTTLLRILSALTGKAQEVYDYDSGKFITKSGVQDKHNKRQMDYAKRAGGDYRDEVIKGINDRKNLTKEQKEQFLSEVDNYFLKALQDSGNSYSHFRDASRKDSFNKDKFLKEFGISELVYRELLKGANKDNMKLWKQFTSGRLSARDSVGNDIRRRESEGTAVEIHLFDGTFDNPGVITINGNTISTGKGKRKKKSTAGEKKKGSAQNIVNNIDDLDEDDAAQKHREETMKTVNDTVSEKVDGARGWLSNFLKKISPKAIIQLYNKPWEAAANVLDSIGFSIDKLIWGTEDDPQKGIFNKIWFHTQEAMAKMKDWMDDFLDNKLQRWIDKLFGKKGEDGKREGGWFSDTANETKEAFSRMGRSLGNTVKQTLGFQGTAAHGRKVTKSGIVAVSEGELIIPSELNPFYHGATNKTHQMKNERRLAANFFGFYNGGGMPESEAEQAVDKENDPITLKRIADKIKSKIGNSIREGSIADRAVKGTKQFGSDVVDFFGQLFGNSKDTIEKDKEIIANTSKKVLGELNQNKGSIIAGSIIGAGTSLVTGAVVGPLFGAAIGGAVGLISSSETVKKLLFGEIDEKGNRQHNGVLPKDVSNFIYNNVPGMAKGAVIGGVGGLFMGSPVMGAILGAATGFVAKSEGAKKILFGDIELDEKGNVIGRKGGLIAKDIQERFKSAGVPMALGAITGLIAGPFSVPVNMILGSAVGYVATSENFKTWLLGGKDENGNRQGGLVSEIREKVIRNLDEIFHNTGNALTASARNLGENMFNHLKNLLSERYKKLVSQDSNSRIGRMIGRVGQFGKDAVSGLTGKVGDFLGNVSTKQKMFNLSKGFNVYDNSLGRNMFGDERNELRGPNAKGTWASFDTMISSAQEKQSLRDLKQNLEYLKNPKIAKREAINKALIKLQSTLSDLDYQTNNTIISLIRKGNVKGAISILDSQKYELGAAKYNSYKGAITMTIKAINKANDEKANKDSIREILKSQGIKISSISDINNAMDLIDQELKHDRFSEENVEKKEIKTWRDRLINIIASIDVNLANKFGGKSASASNDVLSESTDKVKVVGRDLAKETVNNIDKAKEDRTYGYDWQGNPIEYKIGKDGKPEIAKDDASTDETVKKSNRFLDSITSIPSIFTAGFAGFKSTMKEFFVGDGEEKSGLFGEGSLLDGIFKLFTGGRSITDVLKDPKSVLTSVITTVIAPALIAAGFGGTFNKVAHDISDGAFGSGEQIYYNPETGEQVFKDENGNFVDANGNRVSEVAARSSGSWSLSERLVGNAGYGFLSGRGSITSATFRKPLNILKTGWNSITDTLQNGRFFQNTFNTLSEINPTDLEGARIAAYCDEIYEVLVKGFLNAAEKFPVLLKLTNNFDNMAKSISSKIAKYLGKSGTKGVLDTVAAHPIAQVALAVIDFIGGYEDARTTLGIIKEPTVGQRVLSGLLRMIKNLIPIVGSFIPDQLVIDVLCDYVGPAFNIAPEELLKDRADAQAIVDEYNKLNESDLTVTDYIKTQMKDYTAGERIWNDTKSIFTDIGNDWNNIKEQGIGGWFSNIWNEMSTWTNENMDLDDPMGLTGFQYRMMGEFGDKLLPGMLGDWAKVCGDMIGYAASGDIKNLWGVTFDSFKDTSAQDGSVAPTFLTKIIGQLPLFMSKMNYTPVALLMWLIKQPLKLFGFGDGKEGNIFTKIYDKIDESVNIKGLFELVKSGDTKSIIDLDVANTDDPEAGPIKKLFASIPLNIAKMVAVPTSLMIKGGKSIVEKITGYVDKVKKGIDIFKKEYEYGNQLLYEEDSDLVDYFTFEDEDPENPIGGFAKAAIIGARLTAIPVAIIKKFSSNLIEPFKNFIPNLKKTGQIIKSEYEYGKDLLEDPNASFSDYFKIDGAVRLPKSPMDGLAKTIIIGTRLSAIPISLIGKASSFIGDSIKNFIPNLKVIGNVIGSEYQYGKSLLEDPDANFMDFFKVDNLPDTPITGLTKTIIVGSRLAAIPVTVLNKVSSDIGKFIGTYVDGIKATFQVAKQEFNTGLDIIYSEGSFFDKVGLMFNVDGISLNSPGGAMAATFIVGSRLSAVPVALFETTGKKISEGVSEYIDGIKAIMQVAKQEFITGTNILKDNESTVIEKITDMFTVTGLDATKPGAGLAYSFIVGSRLASVPVALASAASKWAGDKIKDSIDAVKKDNETYKTSVDALKELADEHDIKGIIDYEANFGGSPLSGVYKFAFGTTKILQSISGVIQTITDAVDISGMIDSAKEKVEGWLESGFENVKDYVTGGGSGFVSQVDPRYSNMRIGNSTVGQKGCAPAVASMLAGNYGRNLSMEDAVRMASGYQNENGTTVDYFRKSLGSRGISTNYLSGKNVPGQVIQSLKNGEQVILLGSDPGNRTKDTSPFGPNGHYVLATGIDRAGNIIISDPESSESRAYNPSILTKARIGIGTSRGGAGSSSYANPVAEQVWRFFTSHGYSPAATAGIMGNIYQESGFNPANIQGNGAGPAAGLFQWEKYNTSGTRWGNMKNYATSQGKDWTDLNSQLNFALSELNSSDINNRLMNRQPNGQPFRSKDITEGGITYKTTEGLPGGLEEFKKLSDIQKAMVLFEASFERAGKPNFARRLEAAKEYYNLYSGSTYTGNYNPNTASNASINSNITTTSSAPEKLTLGNVLSAISTAFGAIGNIFTGNSSTDMGGITTTSATNLGPVPTGKGNNAQLKIVQWAKSRLGLNQYTQDANLRTQVGSGYSDCSSFAQWVYKNALGVDPGGYTGAQIQSPQLVTVDSGTTPNKANLEAGDLLFFRSKTNNGRYKNVGHVEIYDGNGNVIGHGSGVGPKVRNLDQYVADRAASNAGYIQTMRYKDIANAAGGSSGLLLRSNPGAKLYGNKLNTASINFRNYSGGSSKLAVKTANIVRQVRNNISSTTRMPAGAGTTTSDPNAKLLQILVEILNKIANNTAPIELIYKAFIDYAKSKGITNASQIASNAASQGNDEPDPSITALIGTLAEIARG